MNGGSREGLQKAISPEQMPPSAGSSDSDDLAELLTGEDARWGRVNFASSRYYTIIKTHGVSAVIFNIAQPSNFSAHHCFTRQRHASLVREGWKKKNNTH